MTSERQLASAEPEELLRLRDLLSALLERGSRINPNKPLRYWYPLSVANYGLDEILGALDSLASFRTTMWEKTAEFEREFGSYVGTREAVMVNSGSSADLLVAFALTNPQRQALSRGDEVLVPSVTWPTQIWSLMMAGLSVTFVDTDPRTLNMDLADLERKVGPRTRAISVVHLMGNPVDMDRVLRIASTHDLIVLEDCCEALGARFRGQHVGTFGVASAFSFFFSHHITTMEGGAVCTNDPELSDLLRLLRAHGWARNTRYTAPAQVEGVDPRYVFWNWGFNVRPTELQAAFGLEQVRKLSGFVASRQRNATRFGAFLSRHRDIMHLMEVTHDAECSWFALPIVLEERCPFSRAELVEYLEEAGVETRPIVAGNLARQPVCSFFPELQGMDLPGADVVHDRGFYVGLHPHQDDAMIDRLCETFEAFLHRRV